MKKIFSYILLVILGCTGCSKSSLMQYNTSTDIYFSNRYDDYFEDTARHSFSRSPLSKDTTLDVYVNIIGEVAPVNRAFSLVIDSSQTTAVAGKHYYLPVADSLMIPAGKVSRKFPLVIMRSPDLYENSVTLVLKLVPNKNFQTNIKVFDYAAPYVVSALTKRIVIDDILPQPGLWEKNKDALGTYSRKKLELMVKQLSLSLKRFYDSPTYSTTQLTNLAKQMQAYLNQQQQAGSHVLEADNSAMKMGPDAQ